MSFPHLPPWPVTADTQERVRDWQGVSAADCGNTL